MTRGPGVCVIARRDVSVAGKTAVIVFVDMEPKDKGKRMKDDRVRGSVQDVYPSEMKCVVLLISSF